MWVVMDIGCIECGESSNVVTLCNKEDVAREMARRLNESELTWQGGQHHFEAFEIPEYGIFSDSMYEKALGLITEK